MKFFEGMQRFFESIGEYVKNFSNLFFIFIGAFALVSLVIIVMTSFAYECKMTKTIDKINKFLERNPRINDDNLVAFNNIMKAGSVPKTLRRQWQQFMLYREHPASYYMSFKHCVENPLRNSTYNQQMTVYRIISYVLVVLSLVVSAFMATPASFTSVLQEILVIPVMILVLYWLISMILNLIHSAISGDLFQNYQYFEINMDKAMLTLPEFVDYEVLFSQDEIRRGIPVLFAYLQKRAIQEQQELEKARLKSVDHEKFDFDKAGLDGSLVLDRAMRETENFTAQRKKYMQEIERVNNEINVLENNYKEQTKEFQRQVQTSKETVENLKEQLEQASSTIEINYIKKQMRDEINRQQMAEKEFDILTDKHNQEVKSLHQEIKHYEEETKNAKEALEVAMLSEFNTYSIKVYDNLEKIVDDKMQDKVDEYKDQIKGLEVELEEKNEELENVYTRYQEVLSQVPEQTEGGEQIPTVEELPKKGKKKKKPEEPVGGMDQPVYDDYSNQADYQQEYTDYNEQTYDQANDFEQYDNNQQYDNYIATDGYEQHDDNNQYGEYNEYQPYDNQYMTEDNQTEFTEEYVPSSDDIFNDSEEYVPLSEEPIQNEFNDQYVPMETEYQSDDGGYIPVNNEYQVEDEQYTPLNDYKEINDYIPQSENFDTTEQVTDYVPLNNDGEFALAEAEDEQLDGEYVPTSNENEYNFQENDEYIPQTKADKESVVSSADEFDDSDFDIDFTKPNTATEEFEDMDFEFDLGDDEPDEDEGIEQKPVDFEDIGDFDLNKILGVYDDVPTEDKEDAEINEEPIKRDIVETEKVANDDDPQPEKLEEKIEVLEPVVKRKAGRPRKVVDQEEVKPKRRVGRPRKIVDESELQKPKRKAGRPRKNVEATEVVEKRKAGRPKKLVDDSLEVLAKPKRKAGRPRKENLIQEVDQPKRKAGRPRKVEAPVEIEQPKRRVGRPKKSSSTDVLTKPATKRRGRPRKEEAKVEVEQPRRKAGRPRKLVVEDTTKRKVGRPKKQDDNVKASGGEPKRRGRPRKN